MVYHEFEKKHLFGNKRITVIFFPQIDVYCHSSSYQRLVYHHQRSHLVEPVAKINVKEIQLWIIGLFLLGFVPIEGVFFLLQYQQICRWWVCDDFDCQHSVSIMFVWYLGRKIKNSFISFEKIDKNLPVLNDLSKDETVPKYSTHLINITKTNNLDEIESKIMYSLIRKYPKRAHV